MAPLVREFSDGWYYRRGSSAYYRWRGPFVTEHVAWSVRESVTGGPWALPRQEGK
jgi:hypothetical protein